MSWSTAIPQFTDAYSDDRQVCASMQSDQSLHYAYSKDSLRPIVS